MPTMMAIDKAISTNPDFMQRDSVRLPPVCVLQVSSLACALSLTKTEGLSTSCVKLEEKCCFHGTNLAIAESVVCLRLTLT